MDGDLEAGSAAASHSSLRLPLSLLTSSSPADLPRLRVLVVGDSGVGKSVLVQRIAGRSVDESRDTASTTTGCATECKLFQYRGHTTGHAAAAATHGLHNGAVHANSSLQHRSSSAAVSSSSYSAAPSSPSGAHSLYFVELWDLSGHRKYLASRPLFYGSVGFNALILVFDLMNRKSYENIRNWIKEIVRVDKERGIEEKFGYESSHDDSTSSWPSSSSSLRSGPSPHQSPSLRPSQSPPLSGAGGSSPSLGASSTSPSLLSALSSALGHLPVLLIGNKLDEYRDNKAEQGTYESVKDYGLDSIYLSALDPKEDFASLDRFFDRVVQRRMQRSASGSSSSSAAASVTSAASSSSRRYSSSSSPYQHPIVPPADSEQSAPGINNRRMAPFAPRPSFSSSSAAASSTAGPAAYPPAFSIAESSAAPTGGGGLGAGRRSAEWNAPPGRYASSASSASRGAIPSH